MSVGIIMYDYSLLEKYQDVKIKARVFDLTAPDEFSDINDFEELMSKAHYNQNVRILLRKDYFSEKLGRLLVHVEWAEYSKVKISPFYNKYANTVVNPDAIPGG